jgi:polyphosphate kinase 2 (PPK2 family)
VLVARLNNFVPEKVWNRRYEEINHFEQLLSQNGMLILKFFLYISYDE